MDAINKKYMETLPDEEEEETEAEYEQRMFGLLKFKADKRFLDYKVFTHSGSPDKLSLVLVYFSDRILNEKAE